EGLVHAAAEDPGRYVVVAVPGLVVAGLAIRAPRGELPVLAVLAAVAPLAPHRGFAAGLAVATLGIGRAVVTPLAMAIAIRQFAGEIVGIVARVASAPARLRVAPGVIVPSGGPGSGRVSKARHRVAPWWGKAMVARPAWRACIGRVQIPLSVPPRCHGAAHGASTRPPRWHIVPPPFPRTTPHDPAHRRRPPHVRGQHPQRRGLPGRPGARDRRRR